MAEPEFISLPTMTMAEPPLMFPSSIVVDGAAIRLHADGTWEGDREAFVKAVSERKVYGGFPNDVAILWLIVGALTPDRKR